MIRVGIIELAECLEDRIIFDGRNIRSSAGAAGRPDLHGMGRGEQARSQPP